MFETFIRFILHIKEMVCCFVLDINMTFTAAVVTSACAAPVYMVLLNVLLNILLLLFCRVILCVFAQGVELNVSENCKTCVHLFNRNEQSLRFSGTTLVFLIRNG